MIRVRWSVLLDIFGFVSQSRMNKMKLNFVIKELNENYVINVKFNSTNISDYITVNKILETLQFYCHITDDIIHINHTDVNILNFLGLNLYKTYFELKNTSHLKTVTLSKLYLEYDLETIPKNFFE